VARWQVRIAQQASGSSPAGGSSIISGVGAWSLPFAPVVAVGDLIYATGFPFVAGLADNSALATTPAMGVVIAKPAAFSAAVAYMGEVPGFFGLSIGSVYYMGLAGAITTTPPAVIGDVVQEVGVAIAASVLLFNPGPTTVVL